MWPVERDGHGLVLEVEVHHLVEVVGVAVAVVERAGEGVLEERRHDHAGRRVPVPERQREGIVADELPERLLVEVDVHAVPRREDPREVHVEGCVLVLRVVPVVVVAVGLVDRRLRHEAQRVRRRQRLHLPHRLLVLLLVLPAEEVHRPADALHPRLPREVDDGHLPRRWARDGPVHALDERVVDLITLGALFLELRAVGDGGEALVPDEAGGDAAQASEDLPPGEPEEAAVVAAPGGPARHPAGAEAGGGALLGRACRGLGGRRRDEGAGGGAGARHAPVHAGT